MRLPTKLQNTRTCISSRSRDPGGVGGWGGGMNSNKVDRKVNNLGVYCD